MSDSSYVAATLRDGGQPNVVGCYAQLTVTVYANPVLCVVNVDSTAL